MEIEKMKQMIIINNWKIIKQADDWYHILNDTCDIRIYGDDMQLGAGAVDNTFIYIYNKGQYVASIWIEGQKNIDKIKELIGA